DSQGQYVFNSVDVSSGDILTLYLDNQTEKAVTVEVGSGGSGDINQDLYQNHLILRSEDSGPTALTNSLLNTAASNGDSDLSAIYTVDSGALNVKDGKSLTLHSGGLFTPGGRVNVGGVFKVGGTL